MSASLVTAIQSALARELPDRSVREIGEIARRVARSVESQRIKDREDPW